MSNQPKNHHYVPAFYLAGFTLGGTDQDKLYVLDKSLKKTWEVSPKQAAKSNHFYRVDLDGLDPTGIEKGLAKVEGQCAEAIRNTISAKAIPSGTDFDILLNFVSLMSVRVPAIRNILSRFNDGVIKNLGMAAFSGPEGAKRLQHYAEQNGQTFTDEYIEQMQAFIQSNDYTADFDQNWHVEMMLHANDTVLQILPLSVGTENQPVIGG